MNKLSPEMPELQSMNITADNITKLKSLFPEAFNEDSVDFEVLKQLLGENVDDKEERYGLNWHGKRQARQLALTPSRGTLRPCKDESVDWDNTKNLMIEGDNLEVLKLLQKSYAGKVKLIYIDPPYNTGKDFVYPDNFQDNMKNYLEITGQTEDGARLSTNTETSGRYHTDWLNMMYPRLKLARNLLSEDGVIFISIDDSEIENLKITCNDIFGEDNFISTISRLMKTGGAKGNFFTPNVEFILVYAKNINRATHFRAKIGAEQIATYYNKTQSGGIRDGEIYGEERLYKASLDARANQRYWIECPDGSFVIPPGSTFPNSVKEGVQITPERGDGVWKWTYTRYKEEYNLGNIVFKETTTSALVDEEGKQAKYNIYNKLWLKDQQEKGMVPGNLINKWENRQSSKELKELGIPFDFAKPTNLLKYLVEISRVKENEIVMDFFAGSGSFGHSLYKYNAENNTSLKYILVQLPEKLSFDNQEQKQAYNFCVQERLPKTICELTKERLRRAGKKVREDNPEWKGDVGFRVFKLDTSNIRPWEASAETLSQQLDAYVSPILEGRSEEDLLTELMLKRGIDLSVNVETRQFDGLTVSCVDGGKLFTCFAKQIPASSVEELTKGIIDWHKSLKAGKDTVCYFLDDAFENNVAKTNLCAILEQHGLTNLHSL
ncbi:site-specific DNA-methyltransferase [Salmonella enterica subsp. enterica serovar Mbandaka]|nr:site-specific DNA-methyltransferase [Salmonella enterica subsp. enterica serovar Mbandaka]EDI7407070.1 site-specific DNA-methyltransferase [Salmonella enterica subsp. enterica serovar Mbandaka]EDR7683431.1 site-specific DNA-methyltransferase [Salmonella enterica subsp. enterica serovar Mbandaka]EDT8928634.1 site-specific DNA-methyltransferase [Salmonella enterica subsp. enterica serovar Mbandaka]EDW2667418.1 site-specific DNA-methyltransferase [Salmonella enterica subsp. enterica serovar Mba